MTSESFNRVPDSAASRGKRFVTTHWSLVAAGCASSPEAVQALEALCQTYWYPLYVFARRRGISSEDAADLTQGFFAELLAKDFLQAADPQRGRFRTFLLAIFKRFLSQQRQREQAAKRGGGRLKLCLDFDDGERRYAFEPQDDWSADKLFDRRWALTLLEEVLRKLQAEYHQKGRGELFEVCRQWLTGEEVPSQSAEVARQLNMTDGAVRVAVHRMRDRYREILRLEVAGTIDDVDLLDDELRRLRQAIRGEV